LTIKKIGVTITQNDGGDYQLMRKNNKDFELRLYELLGVNLFKKAVYKLEKIIHHKDGMKNINYHPKDINVDSFKDFNKFYYYNGYIHAKNSVVIAALIVFATVVLPAALIVLIPELIKNLYCVMLQRYNYKLMNKSINKKEQRLNEKYEANNIIYDETPQLDVLRIQENRKKLEDIKLYLLGQKDIIVDNSYKEVLDLFEHYLNMQIPGEEATPLDDIPKTDEEHKLTRKKGDYYER
jgi:hypothetical protein